MTISIKHAFVSAKGDGGDTTVVRPSNWNAEHTITLATDKILGRATAGTGAVEEITCTAAARSILDDATIADILVTLGVEVPLPGDGRITMRVTAPTGWLMLNDGTFGDASSGASARANADTAALFAILYDNTTDASCPVLTSAGAATTRAAQGTAANAFNVGHCRLTLPKSLGRAIIGAGTGSGLTARALGSSFGAETVALAIAELPAHTHSNTLTDPGHVHTQDNYDGGAVNAGGGVGGSKVTTNTGSSFTGITITNASVGSGSAHANVQPSTAWNVMVKL